MCSCCGFYRVSVGALLAAALVCGWAATARGQIAVAERGQIVRKQISVGTFFQYVPRASPRGILVVAHGTTQAGDDVPALAEKFLTRWTKFAEAQKLIILAPAFGDDFGSIDGGQPGVPPGGYRGLFGKEIGADEFVERIVEPYGKLVPGASGRFYLYGHSAGGQFANRYCVRHPERVQGAVLSAPGRFAFPDATAA